MIEYKVNGKIYGDYDEALAAEKEYIKEQKEKDKKDKEYDRRRREVTIAYEKYEKLMNDLKKDYPEKFVYNWNDFFRSVFDV